MTEKSWEPWEQAKHHAKSNRKLVGKKFGSTKKFLYLCSSKGGEIPTRATQTKNTNQTNKYYYDYRKDLPNN